MLLILYIHISLKVHLTLGLIDYSVFKMTEVDVEDSNPQTDTYEKF